MLQIKNLSKSYGAKKAVSNLSFVVEDGDIAVLEKINCVNLWIAESLNISKTGTAA